MYAATECPFVQLNIKDVELEVGSEMGNDASERQGGEAVGILSVREKPNVR
jgi:hypothetical protein